MRLEQNNNFKDNEIYSKYIARNILGSLMKGLVVPKRKINRQIWGEGEEVIQNEIQEEEQPKPEKKEKKKSPKKEKPKKEKKEKPKKEKEPKVKG